MGVIPSWVCRFFYTRKSVVSYTTMSFKAYEFDLVQLTMENAPVSEMTDESSEDDDFY